MRSFKSFYLFLCILTMPMFGVAFDFCTDINPSKNLCQTPVIHVRSLIEFCEIEKKANKCEELLSKYPGLSIRDCRMSTVCKPPLSFKGYLRSCIIGAGVSGKEFIVGISNILFGDADVPSEDTINKIQYYKNCTSIQCKREMLGPFLSYFKKEEIEGYPNDKKLNPNDVVNETYLKGFSAATLYRKLLLKLKLSDPDANKKFIEPWSGKEATLPELVDEKVDRILTEAGLKNSACFDAKVAAEMRCHALFTILNPAIAAGLAGKVIQTAGVLIRGESKFQMRAIKAAGREADEQAWTTRIPSAIDLDSYKKKAAHIWNDPKIPFEIKVKSTFDDYIDQRIATLSPDKKAVAETALQDIKLKKNLKNAIYNAHTSKITLDSSIADDVLTKYNILSHEFEHLAQHGKVGIGKHIKDTMINMMKKNVNPNVNRLRDEYEAIGSQWDFLQAIPADVRKKTAEQIKKNPQFTDKMKEVFSKDLEMADVPRDVFVQQVAGASGYTGEYFVTMDRMHDMTILGILSLSNMVQAGSILIPEK